jgi:hypothetical protein
MAWPDLRRLAQSAGLSTFGEEATFEPAGGAPVAARGIFNSDHVRIDLSTGGSVSGNGAMLELRLTDLPTIPLANKDTVIVRGQRYQIRDVQKDSDGMVQLLLTGAKRMD